MFKKKSMRWIALAVSMIVLCGLCFFLGGATADNGDQEVKALPLNWQMNGYLVKKDGTVLETVTVTLTGEVMERPEHGTMLHYALNLPAKFQYMYLSTEGYIQAHDFASIIDVPYEIWFGFGYDTAINSSLFMKNAISVEEEMIIYTFEYPEELEREEVFFVAATDTEATPETIMEYFQIFVDRIVLN